MPAQLDQTVKQAYSRARLARDARFDGVFFTAVKTTGIYCRPICPANLPKEDNVEYHPTAVSAANAGFRPCLRCRPESAPRSAAWQGIDTTVQRALELIHHGALQHHGVDALAERVGVSDRYLRELFQKRLGVSPKHYAIYQQCLFAKQLLHQSDLAISEIAFASGFNSVRRFNEAMLEHLSLAPNLIRKQASPLASAASPPMGLELQLAYRPPFAFKEMHAFLKRRLIQGLEWADETNYGRTIAYNDVKGSFEISHDVSRSCLQLKLKLNDTSSMFAIHQRIRELFDVDANIDAIDDHLLAELNGAIDYHKGLRIPGIWSTFEAGVRAILGQQVSVIAAQKLVQILVDKLGEPLPKDLRANRDLRLFPTPQAIANSNLDFFKMPQARKDCLRRFAHHYFTSEQPDNTDTWLELKGIGPWTVNYARLRGSKDPDVWLAGDAGVKNALKAVGDLNDLSRFAPWRSYLTFQLWNQL